MLRLRRGERERAPWALRAAACLVGLLGLLAQPGLVSAGEEVGRVEKLPAAAGDHWFWASDILMHRASLFDGDSGRLLGSITAGTPGVGFIILPLRSHDGSEIYIAESYFSRGVRGERTDVVTVYDARTFEPQAEIGIPPRRAEYFPGVASSTLSDDGRYLAVFNVAPAQSITIVDVQERRFVEEIDTVGCACVFNAGPRRFFTICADGSLLQLTIPEDGGAAAIERIEPFFEPMVDPMMEKGARDGDLWYFPSFEGVLYKVDVSGPKLVAARAFDLVTQEDRDQDWRVGGSQVVAVHAPTDRLYVLFHQGGKDTHKEPGREIRVYDLASGERIARIAPESPLLSTVRVYSGLGSEGGMLDSALEWALGKVVPNTGVNGIHVTQDAEPKLVALSLVPPAIVIYDALTGEPERDVAEPGVALGLLLKP